MVTTRGGGRKRPEGGIDALGVAFDDDNALANAGLLLSATLAGRLGLERLVDETVRLGRRPGAFSPGRKVMTLVHSLLAGGDSIEDADVLRAGSSQAVLGHRVMAPSTLGTFLRSFSFGHVRQLDRVAEVALGRAWAAGCGPGAAPMTIDLDSTICEVHGYRKQGAAFGYTRVRGYHPMLATRAETGEILHVRMRKGSANSGRGAQRFVRELCGRVRRAGAAGELTIRADAGFWSATVIGACRHHDVRFSITVRQVPAVKEAIAAIPEPDWEPIDYTPGAIAQVAETRYQGMRLLVRRSRRDEPQGELVPDWRYHAFVSDRQGTTRALDADHRAHAVIELAIRDVKEGSGLAHCPSGRFFANSAWLVIAALAHNLVRWLARIGLGLVGPVVAATLRRRLLAAPGRITRSGRRRTLHLPRAWPWAEPFQGALARLRAVSLQI
jgi:hypothetical protein